MTQDREVAAEIRLRFASIKARALASADTRDIEGQLVELLAYLGQLDAETRPQAERAIISEFEVFEPGVVDVVEFTMHTLRWERVKDALAARANTDSDFRQRAEARRALGAFESTWPDGDIYVSYRRAGDG